jgi:hypothetical protein
MPGKVHSISNIKLEKYKDKTILFIVLLLQLRRDMYPEIKYK